ncbi:MAG: septum formation inhibitor Maf [Proteobacteria bacterium]|nr:septum formation inhibitor Maf [Pseudomonadota bacterium]
MPSPRLILASASPRRQDLLATLGVDFHCQPADIDESVRSGEAPLDYVRRMATEKAAVVAQAHRGNTYAVLGADTTVVLDGKILGKPTNHEDALDILSRLSGRRHRVITALCLSAQAEINVCTVATDVQFVPLTKQVCRAYLATEEPWDKAGSYAIQGLGGAFVSEIRGSYSNVVGLPLAETWELLRARGIATALTPAGD